MLARNWHRHIAKKRFPALRENRFLWFANDDDNQPQNPEREQGVPEQPEMPEQSPGAIETLTNVTRQSIESVRPIVAKNVAQSPFLLETSIRLLEQQKANGVNTPNIESIITKGNRYLELRDSGKDGSVLAAEIDEDISGQLEQPELAAALTQAFEKRMAHIHELKRHIGNAPLKDIVALEQKLALGDTDKVSQMLTNPDVWTDEEVNDALQQIGIELNDIAPPSSEGYRREESAALKGTLAALKIDVPRTATKEDRLQLLHEKIIAARKIANLEKNDIGTETTVENTDEMEQVLFRQLLQARKNLEAALATTGENYRRRLREVIAKLHTKAGGSDPSLLAKYFGISEEAWIRRMMEIDAPIQQAMREAQADDPTKLPDITDAAFTQKAQVLQKELTELNWLKSDDESIIREGLLGTAKQDKTDTVRWAETRNVRLNKAVSALDSDAKLRSGIRQLLETDESIDGLKHHAAMAERIASGNASQSEQSYMYRYLNEERQKRLDMLLLAIETPSFMARLLKEKGELSRVSLDNNEAERDELFQELDVAMGTLGGHPLLRHETCEALHISEQLSDVATDTNQGLKSLVHMKTPKSREIIAKCKQNITKLTAAAQELNALQNVTANSSHVKYISEERITEYEAIAKTRNTAACYNRTDGCIYINQSLIRNNEHLEAVLHHEQGHAIVDMLAHKVGVLPMMFVGLNEMLSHQIPGETAGKTFRDLLLTRIEAWQMNALKETILKQELVKLRRNKTVDKNDIEHLAKMRTEARLNEMLMDELVNKYATWVRAGKDTESIPHEDRTLLELLEKGVDNIPIHIDIADYTEPGDAMSLNTTDDELMRQLGGGNGSGGNGNGEGSEGEGAPAESGSHIGSDIMDIQNQFLRVKEFVNKHQDINGVEEFSAWVDRWESAFDDTVKTPFYTPSTSNPISEDLIEARIRDVKDNFVQHSQEEIEKITKAEMDKTESANASKNLWQTLRSIRFVSIMDVVKTFQAMGEDLQRMWKRRSEGAQSMIGKTLTGWIGDSIPYAGQLKHEFERRGNASELEEVKQWKDSLDEADSYELMDTLSKTRNKDQVRAVIELLVERGRLDVNDTRFWQTLKDLSGMNMPIDSCRDNSVLRDKWLQKMITSIWDDKDKYTEWRQSNDSGISSGKEKFTQVADQLSNIAGGLAYALERQLKLYKQGKDSGNMPEEVNPHLYEKLIHYSMSNGKMSMEQKMFYLVQGARYGIISIDRLQALAGENGGVLNQFPMIDYFTAGNNTWPEIEAIGKRIEEDGDPFKPGERTSIWIHSEVLRNEFARQRMSKAMSGARTEALDHEDIPTLAAIMDYKNVEEITGVLSGSRFKISYEAAKNFYTGTGKGLLLKARKAQLANEGKARFTEQDAAEAARTIVTHMHYDNIVTGNAKDGTRISLTLDQIATQQGPSTGGEPVKAFRDPLHELARDALNQAGVSFGQGQLKDVQSADQYLRSPSENASNSIIYDTERQKANFAATGEIQKQLTQAFIQNPGLAQRILAQYADKLKAEGGDEISLKTMENYWDTMRRHEKGKRSKLAL